MTLEPLMTVADTASFLGISRRQVYLLIEQRELPIVKVGSRIRFVPEELRAYLEQRRDEAPNGAAWLRAEA